MHVRRLVSILVISAVVGVHGCRKGEKQRPENAPPIRNLSPNLPPTAPAGSRAITPRSTGMQAFSVDDAKQYVTAHPLAMGISKGTKPTVTKVEFVGSGEVSRRLGGATTGFPDNYLLCYVEVEGPVTFVGPPGSEVTYNRGVLIFDAHTGNLLIRGGMP